MSALDLLTTKQEAESVGVGGGLLDSLYLSTLETMGVVTTVFLVANVAQAVWTVWKEDDDKELGRNKV